MTCQYCLNKTNTFYCENCGNLNEIDGDITYFHLFFNPVRYSYSLSELEDIYYNFQKKIHPDLFQNANDQQKTRSAELSELINNAYKTLKSPLKSAKYFSEINGLFEKNTNIPPIIMEDVFEIQELLQEPELSEEQIADLNAYLISFRNLNKVMTEKISSTFKKYDQNEISLEDIKTEFNEILNQSAYITRLIEQIEEKIDL